MTTMKPGGRAILQRLAELPGGASTHELYSWLTQRGVELLSADFEILPLSEAGLIELQFGDDPRFPRCLITEAGRTALREQRG